MINDYRRSEQRHPRDRSIEEENTDLTSPGEPFEQAMLSWQVEEALRRIGDRHRQIVIEACLRGRPYAEIASALGVPVGTIKSRVYYGMRAMRDAMEELGYES